MDSDELVVICTYKDRGQAEIAKIFLEGEGIPTQLGGEGQGEFPGIIDVEVLVRAQDAPRASQIMEEHERRLAEAANEDDEGDDEADAFEGDEADI